MSVEVKSICIEGECVAAADLTEQQRQDFAVLDRNQDGEVVIRLPGVKDRRVDISYQNIAGYKEDLQRLLQYREFFDRQSGLQFHIYFVPTHIKPKGPISTQTTVDSLPSGLANLKTLDLIPNRSILRDMSIIYRNRSEYMEKRKAAGFSSPESANGMEHIVIDQDYFWSASALHHEVTHSALHLFDAKTIPGWLHQGIAEYVACFDPSRGPEERILLPQKLSAAWNNPFGNDYHDQGIYHAFFLFLETKYTRALFPDFIYYLQAEKKRDGSISPGAATRALLQATRARSLKELEEGYRIWLTDLAVKQEEREKNPPLLKREEGEKRHARIEQHDGFPLLKTAYLKFLMDSTQEELPWLVRDFWRMNRPNRIITLRAQLSQPEGGPTALLFWYYLHEKYGNRYVQMAREEIAEGGSPFILNASWINKDFYSWLWLKQRKIEDKIEEKKKISTPPPLQKPGETDPQTARKWGRLEVGFSFQHVQSGEDRWGAQISLSPRWFLTQNLDLMAEVDFENRARKLNGAVSIGAVVGHPHQGPARVELGVEAGIGLGGALSQSGSPLLNDGAFFQYGMTLYFHVGRGIYLGGRLKLRHEISDPSHVAIEFPLGIRMGF